LGPTSHIFLDSYQHGISALRDHRTGDVWWTLLMGQEFHMRGNQVQYCFGEVGLVGEQAPLEVHSMTDKELTLCWRSGLRGFPTYAKDCSGCDCSKITMTLTDPDTLNFIYYQSAQTTMHANFTFIRRTRKQPLFETTITALMPYEQCTFRHHYGPNIPGMPDLRKKTWQSFPPNAKLPLGCRMRSIFKESMKHPKVIEELEHIKGASANSQYGGRCHQLNGINYLYNKYVTSWLAPAHHYEIPDVKLWYQPPVGPCQPCRVSYTISARIKEDEYISAGFKGDSWEHNEPYPPEKPRPCYFGMCVDEYDSFDSDRIALGYASSSRGHCVREMVSKQYAGMPTDVDEKMLSKTSVERRGDRTVLQFTVLQHWHHDLDPLIPDGPFRFMWAIGKVTGGRDCTADLGYHAERRGLGPLHWLVALGTTPCLPEPFELGDSPSDDSLLV
jgi:hypothetical protein